MADPTAPPPPPGRITLGAAVDELNRRRHRGHADWYVWYEDDPDGPLVLGRDPAEYLTAFEAVAVAERYGRAAPPAGSRPPIT